MATNSSLADVVESASFTVGVLGSARLAPPDPRCLTAYRVGQAVAEQGWTVLTGGYGGLMGETSRGAAEAGGRVIGLPMRTWTTLTPNPWVAENRWCDGYPNRLQHLLECDAIIALDGGIGTLAETTVVWSAAQTEANAPPIVAIGAGWREMLNSISSNLIVDDSDFMHIEVIDHPAQAVAAIRAGIARHRRALPRG